MATDYGGTYGGRPWHDAQPQHSDQAPYGRPPYGGPPYGPPPGWTPPPDHGLQARRRRTRIVAVAVLVLGGLGLVGFGIGALTQVMPRKFTAAQRQQITDWEFGQRWRDVAAGAIFPASVSYTAPGALTRCRPPCPTSIRRASSPPPPGRRCSECTGPDTGNA